MIRLTRISGDIEYVNPDRIERIIDNSGNAQIVFPDGESYPYKESPSEVARKVAEWKLAYGQHIAYLQNQDYENANKARDVLRRLMGLEEPKDD